jgi:DNA-binding beta-propeller fold protein YncE
MSRRPTGRVPAVAAALLAASLAGCATARRVPAAWPAPPATERVRYVRSLTGGMDVEGGMGRFWRKLAGLEAPTRLYHPLGVAVSAQGDVVAVSDQGLAQVLIWDLAANKMATIARDDLAEPPGGVAMEGDRVWVVVPKRKIALSYARDGKPLRAIELPDCERPLGVAVDAERGMLWVSDASSPEGEGHTIHGHALDTGEHKLTIGKKGHGQGELFFPTFLALAPGGGLYVADTMNARVIEFSKDGAFVRQFGERGDRFGQFDKPKGVALDSFGNLYVVDGFFAAVQIFNREAKLLLFFGAPGDSPGFLANPGGIAIDAKNRIYVANGLNYRIDVYELVNTTSNDSRLTEGGVAQQ